MVLIPAMMVRALLDDLRHSIGRVVLLDDIVEVFGPMGWRGFRRLTEIVQCLGKSLAAPVMPPAMRLPAQL
jgi:hypothetical protein